MRYLGNGWRHVRETWGGLVELRYYGGGGLAALFLLAPLAAFATPVLFLAGMYIDDDT